MYKEKHVREAEERREQIMQNLLGPSMEFRFYANVMVSRQEERPDLHVKISSVAL